MSWQDLLKQLIVLVAPVLIGALAHWLGVSQGTTSTMRGADGVRNGVVHGDPRLDPPA